MAARKTRALRAVPLLASTSVDDAATSRALDQVVSAVSKLQKTRARVVIAQDLIVGVNRVAHGLGYACTGYALTATVASASFAHAMDTSNPRPDLEVWITVVGIDQPDAVLEVF